MRRVAHYHGYDVYMPSKKECEDNNIGYPTYMAVDNYFDEAPQDVTPAMSLHDAETIVEMKIWCMQHRK